MPRANRCIEPGRTYHLTHRCHDRSFLLRFAVDRQVYRTMMRERLPFHGILLLNYSLTCNHTHLLLRVRDGTRESLARFMQSLEGDFAQYFNLRKKRQGAFWSDRYHAVMIQGGTHLRRCMVYIDLNMVRAGVVNHPTDWAWCGYRELMGLRRRNRLIDREALCQAVGLPYPEGLDVFREGHRAAVEEALKRRELQRQAYWTESIAVGDRAWVEEIAGRVDGRMHLCVEEAVDGRGDAWRVRESRPPWGDNMGSFSGPEIGP